MTDISFDYDNQLGEQVAYHGTSYRVRAVRDDHPENPFKSWDSHWPMIVDYQGRGHRFDTYDNCKGASLDDPIARFTDGQLIKHQGAIIAAMDGDAADFATHKRDYRSDYNSMAALIRDYCSDALQAVSDSDKLATFAALYDLLRIPNLCTSSHGYSQGDYAELLIVATPEAQSEFGWKAGRPATSDMEGQANLYSAWAWGDVYGVVIERKSGDEWTEIDSCWGYYGNDMDESGLAEVALSVIKYDIADCKAKRGDKLKQLIRANAPLATRAAILGAMPC